MRLEAAAVDDDSNMSRTLRVERLARLCQAALGRGLWYPAVGAAPDRRMHCRPLRHKRVDIQGIDGSEVLDIASEQRQQVQLCGDGDRRIGHLQAVAQRQRFQRRRRIVRDLIGDRQNRGSSVLQQLFHRGQFLLAAHAFQQSHQLTAERVSEASWLSLRVAAGKPRRCPISTSVSNSAGTTGAAASCSMRTVPRMSAGAASFVCQVAGGSSTLTCSMMTSIMTTALWDLTRTTERAQCARGHTRTGDGARSAVLRRSLREAIGLGFGAGSAPVRNRICRRR